MRKTTIQQTNKIVKLFQIQKNTHTFNYIIHTIPIHQKPKHFMSSHETKIEKIIILNKKTQ